MTVKHECSERVWNDTRRIFQPCSRPATAEYNAKWYCWQHDPKRKAEEAADRRNAEEARADRQATRYARRTRNARLAALVTPGLAALLERLADYARQAAHAAKGYPDDVDCAYNDEEITRELTARIREALALEGHK